MVVEPGSDGSRVLVPAEEGFVVPDGDTFARDVAATVAVDPPLLSARDSFVDAVVNSGGQVTSETITTIGNPEGGEVIIQDGPAGATSIYPPPGMPVPYGVPGIRLTADVPTGAFGSISDTVLSLGSVVNFNQSVYDTGLPLEDYDARISALRASLVRLNNLLDDATSVTDIVELENAIAERRSELASYQSQQQRAVEQTSTARVTLTLVTPETVADYLTPQPGPSVFKQSIQTTFLDTWPVFVVVALLTTPVWLLSVAVLVVVRRNRRTGQP